MDLNKYQILTGKTISDSQSTKYEALIERAMLELETRLGWMFNTDDFVTEVGKTKNDCSCKYNGAINDLIQPDVVVGQLRVFPINWKDRFFNVDPYFKLNKVKLVISAREDSAFTVQEGDYITVKEIKDFEPSFSAHGIAKYIEKCPTCFCNCDCKDCIFLMVDAEWISADIMPKDLQHLICDYVDYLAELSEISLLLKSESVDGHSTSMRDNIYSLNPYDSLVNKRKLMKYVGPYGNFKRIPIL